MRHIAVWTLKRGCLEPPEYLSAEDQWQVEREYVLASLERDKPLTQEERWREQGFKMGFNRRQRRIA